MKILIDHDAYDTGRMRFTLVIGSFLFNGGQTKLTIPNLTRFESRWMLGFICDAAKDFVTYADTAVKSIDISRIKENNEWRIEVIKNVREDRQEIHSGGEGGDSGAGKAGPGLGESD